ncbi:hypothetical protein C8Q73DRAFT_124019 [Cubamyces lactineus]|nr:hypothetical protein C8Q73DRAFT_124019 [Cubamyces lactineus]
MKHATRRRTLRRAMSSSKSPISISPGPTTVFPRAAGTPFARVASVCRLCSTVARTSSLTSSYSHSRSSSPLSVPSEAACLVVLTLLASRAPGPGRCGALALAGPWCSAARSLSSSIRPLLSLPALLCTGSRTSHAPPAIPVSLCCALSLSNPLSHPGSPSHIHHPPPSPTSRLSDKLCSDLSVHPSLSSVPRRAAQGPPLADGCPCGHLLPLPCSPHAASQSRFIALVLAPAAGAAIRLCHRLFERVPSYTPLSLVYSSESHSAFLRLVPSEGPRLLYIDARRIILEIGAGKRIPLFGSRKNKCVVVLCGRIENVERLVMSQYSVLASGGNDLEVQPIVGSTQMCERRGMV